jgi:hypothetical protein
MAVAASILTAAHHMLRDGVEYRDLGPDYFVRRDSARVAERLARRIRDRDRYFANISMISKRKKFS